MRLPGLLLAALAATSFAGAEDGERVVLEAKKFEFSQKEIRLKKGRRVTIVLTSPDFEHGFAIPELGVRADGVPGKPVQVTFIADRAGRFQFLCDNFCGEDHDGMAGVVVVSED